jgi:hypothetical protein
MRREDLETVGLRAFFRRIRIAPGFRLNLSKSGISLNAGGRGHWFTVGPRGGPATVRLARTDLFYTTKLGRRRTLRASNKGSRPILGAEMKALVCCASCLSVSAAIAEPMRFEIKETGGKCCVNWVQATGDITEDTPNVFEAFLRSSKFLPKVVRLNSEGGSLRGGVMLGELIRSHGFATEVGSSKLNGDVPIPGSKNIFTKTPGSCSSACAMAFLGGVERTLDPDSTLGFHVVSNPNVSESDLRELITLESLYFREMGVDTRLMTLLIEAGPNVMRGIRPDEARKLRVITGEAGCSACP